MIRRLPTRMPPIPNPPIPRSYSAVVRIAFATDWRREGPTELAIEWNVVGSDLKVDIRALRRAAIAERGMLAGVFLAALWASADRLE